MTASSSDDAVSKKQKKSKKAGKKSRRKSKHDERSRERTHSVSSDSSDSSSTQRRKRKDKKARKKAKKHKREGKSPDSVDVSAGATRPSSDIADRLRELAEPSAGPEPAEAAAVAAVKPKGPMTKEQWDKHQNTLRRVHDPETGRTRLIKGDGEIMEEIVSRDIHVAINKAATKADGAYFETVLGLRKHK